MQLSHLTPAGERERPRVEIHLTSFSLPVAHVSDFYWVPLIAVVITAACSSCENLISLQIAALRESWLCCQGNNRPGKGDGPIGSILNRRKTFKINYFSTTSGKAICGVWRSKTLPSVIHDSQVKKNLFKNLVELLLKL